MKKVHFIGIGGVGMAGLAVLLKNGGDEVSGCDKYDSPRVEWLRKQGIAVAIGHDAAHVADADLTVVTPAVRRDNPELLASRCVRCRGEMLAELVNSRPMSIAVCGSHGKTTTSTFIARLLIALGEKVEWAIGGETGDFPVAGVSDGGGREDGRECGRGKSSATVVEADESDGTLALYRPSILVVTNCEYDHPDHFKTPADYFECFARARARAGEVVEAEEVWRRRGRESWNGLADLPEHNRKNALAAVEVALRRGHGADAINRSLPQVVATLPDRRFQKIAEGVYTDYAHHPTEMRCAVAMARRICRGALRVLFQPHRYSRTKALLNDFPAAFEGADETILCPTYAAFEPPIEGGDIADLYRAVRGAGRRVMLARSCAEAWEHARNSMREGDVTLLLGAGDIIKLAPVVASGAARAARRIWIGAGTNTWKPELNLSVEYVRSAGRAGEPGSTLKIPWMAGIPGTIGGWVKMNAGAFGHTISEVLRRVKVDGEWIDAADCGFGYRASSIAGEIQDIELDEEKYAAALRDGTDYLSRRKRFPAGTKGSVFKNPAGDFAGRLLEAAGAKELRAGGAEVWSEHANVIIAGADATASDFLALARLMRERVRLRFGITLEPEVQGLEEPGFTP